MKKRVLMVMIFSLISLLIVSFVSPIDYKKSDDLINNKYFLNSVKSFFSFKLSDSIYNRYVEEGVEKDIEYSGFLKGTKVLMADGSYKNIEYVKIGDFVMGFDEKTGENKVSEVVDTFYHSEDENQGYLIINGKLKITKEHEVFVNGGWIEIGNAKIGDKLKLVDDEEIIESIEKIDEKVETYNLQIEGTNNYYAEDVLVHNACELKALKMDLDNFDERIIIDGYEGNLIFKNIFDSKTGKYILTVEDAANSYEFRIQTSRVIIEDNLLGETYVFDLNPEKQGIRLFDRSQELGVGIEDTSGIRVEIPELISEGKLRMFPKGGTEIEARVFSEKEITINLPLGGEIIISYNPSDKMFSIFNPENMPVSVRLHDPDTTTGQFKVIGLDEYEQEIGRIREWLEGEEATSEELVQLESRGMNLKEIFDKDGKLIGKQLVIDIPNEGQIRVYNPEQLEVKFRNLHSQGSEAELRIFRPTTPKPGTTYDKTLNWQVRKISYPNNAPETIKKVQLEVWDKLYLGEQNPGAIRREGKILIENGYVLAGIEKRAGRIVPNFAWVDEDGIIHRKVIVVKSGGQIKVEYDGFSDVDPWSRTRSVESTRELYNLVKENDGELYKKGYRPYCPDCSVYSSYEDRVDMALLRDVNGIIEGIILKKETGTGGFPVALVIGREEKFGIPIPIREIIEDYRGSRISLIDITDNPRAKGLYVGDVRVPKANEIKGIEARLEIFDSNGNLIYEMSVIAEEVGSEIKVYKKHGDTLYPVQRDIDELIYIEGSEDFGKYVTAVHYENNPLKPKVELGEGGYARIYDKNNKLLGGMDFSDFQAEASGTTSLGAKRYTKPTIGSRAFGVGDEGVEISIDSWKGRNPRILLEEELKSQGIKLIGGKGEVAIELVKDNSMAFYQISETGEIVGIVPETFNSLKIIRFSDKGKVVYYIEKGAVNDQHKGLRIEKEKPNMFNGKNRLRVYYSSSGVKRSRTYYFNKEDKVFFDEEKRLLMEIEKRTENSLEDFEGVKVRYYKGVSDGRYVLYTDYTGKQKIYEIGMPKSEFIGSNSPNEIVDPKRNIRAVLKSDKDGIRYEFSSSYYLDEEFSLDRVFRRDKADYNPRDRRLIYKFSESGDGTKFLVRDKENLKVLDSYRDLGDVADIPPSRKRFTTLYVYDKASGLWGNKVFEREVLEIRTIADEVIFIDLRTGKQIIVDSDGKFKFINPKGIKTEIDSNVRSLNEEGIYFSTDSIYVPPEELVFPKVLPLDPKPAGVLKINGEQVKRIDFSSTDISHITQDPIYKLDPANYEPATMTILAPSEIGVYYTPTEYTKSVNIIYDEGVLRVYASDSGERLVINPKTGTYSYIRDIGLSPIFSIKGKRATFIHKLKVEPGQKIRFDRKLPNVPLLERRVVGFNINPHSIEPEVPPGWNKVGNEESVIRDLFGGIDPMMVKGVALVDISDNIARIEINGISYVRKIDSIDSLIPEIVVRDFVEKIKELRKGGLFVDSPRGVVYKFKCHPISNRVCTNLDWVEGVLITDYVDGGLFHDELGDMVAQIHKYYGDNAYLVRADTQIITDVLGLLDNKPEHFVAMSDRLYHFDIDEVGGLNFFILESPSRYGWTFTQTLRNNMQQAWSTEPQYNTLEFKRVLLERVRWYQENRQVIDEKLRRALRDAYRGSREIESIDEKLGNVAKNIDKLTDKYETEWRILEIDGLTSQ